MPLTRQPQLPDSPVNQRNQAHLLAALNSPDSDARGNAVEALALDNAMLPALCRHLAHERTPSVIQLIAIAVLRQPDVYCAEALVALLHPGDLILNNVLADILRLYPADLLPMAKAELRHESVDMRTIWLQIVANWPLQERQIILEPLLNDETDLGLAATIVELLADSRSTRFVPLFRHLAARFHTNSFVQFTVQQAIAQLESSND